MNGIYEKSLGAFLAHHACDAQSTTNTIRSEAFSALCCVARNCVDVFEYVVGCHIHGLRLADIVTFVVIWGGHVRETIDVMRLWVWAGYAV